MQKTKTLGVLALIAVVGASLGATSGLALATPINYGDFTGTNVQFLQVTEDSSTDPTPLFGTPTVSGDGIAFNPTTFGSFAFNGGSDLTDGTLTTMICALPGRYIPALSFSESGDYTLAGIGGAATTANVSLSFFITVLEVNNVAIAPQSFSGLGTMNPSGGTFDLFNEGQGAAVIWNGSAVLNIDTFLAGLGYGSNSHATKLTFTIDNSLSTTSEAGTAAFIKKKEIGGVAVAVVPTPGSVALLGIAGLVAIRRKR